MRHLAAAALVLAALLAACGGGSGGGPPASGSITPAPQLRTDLLFGYYYGRADFILEQVDHANLYFVAGDPAEQVATLKAARAAGIRNLVLMLPHANAAGATPGAAERFEWLMQLEAAGVLTEDIVAVYWIDEANTDRHRRTAAQLRDQNAILRTVMAEFPALAGAKLATFYACPGDYPAIDSFDWVGCDDYGPGCAALDRYVEPMRRALLRGQRLMVIPGGADPWRQDPACFEAYAHGHAEVVAIVPFIWQTVVDEGVTYRGIRENGMAPLYREAGRKAVGR